MLRGTVHSAGDDTPLAGVVIRPIRGGSLDGTVTGPAGTFSLSAPLEPFSLVALKIGFAAETLLVARQDTAILIRLHPAAIELSAITVAAEPTYSAASSRTIRALDIALRPRETSQELLRLVPGLVIAQHAGGGKAEQIFLRGFDADHGTDVAISVDGVPVNLVSHAHGQGYADLHFVMPEVVETADVRKGPYDAQDGDFATAGAVDLRTRERAAGSSVTTRGGSFQTVHGTGILPFGGDAAHAGGYLAVSGHRTNGPFVNPQDYGRLNGFSKITAPVGSDVQFFLTGSAFESSWNASGEVPSRAVAQRLIPRFGALDPSEGGRTHRYDLVAGLRSAAGGASDFQLQAYATRYDFRLWSNFTFFLTDSVHGDEIEQVDNRWVAGAHATLTTRRRVGSLAGRTTISVGGRADWTDVGLNHVERRSFLESFVAARVGVRHGFGWVKQDVVLARAVRLQVALRGDLFQYAVTDRLGPSATNRLNASGSRTRGIVSPKVNLAYEVSRSTTLFANAGLGFHSNDARDVILAGSRDTFLPRAFGVETGARFAWKGGSAALALWGIDLESELVWSGDEGTTEASGRTRRVGMDVEGRVRLTSWLWGDLDVNLARGRFGDEPKGANFVPLAPTNTATAGLTLRDVGALSGALRFRHIGGRPADEDDTIRALGYTLWELVGNYQIGRIALVAALDNLFNVQWNEAQFATTSRLAGEPDGGITELNFTPGARRSLQVGLAYRF